MIENGILPGWRDIERTVAAVFGGHGTENKGVFDVVVTPEQSNDDVGFSVKSKNLSGANVMHKITTTGRVYMELANSPAKFWDALEQEKLAEADFKAGRNPETFGRVILETVHSWHAAAAVSHAAFTGRKLNLDSSVYLTMSYGRRLDSKSLVYQWHSFALDFPEDIVWEFRSEKSLRGMDPGFPDEVLFDWYGLSGGQLKYYPRADRALFASNQFTLKAPPHVSLIDKAASYWPKEWRQATDDLDA